MNQFHILMVALGVFVIAGVHPGQAEDETKERAQSISLRKEVDRVIHQCLTVLEGEQDFEGYWTAADYPGLTALVVRAFLETPVDSEKWQKSEVVSKGIAFLKKNVQEDGGIYNRGLYSYNTAISLMSLTVFSQVAEKRSLMDEEELEELNRIMTEARNYVVSQQQFYTEEDFKMFSGGIGYGRSSELTDLSNSSFAIQALHETRRLVKDTDEQTELNWEAAIQFLENTQNLPSANKQEWASDDPDNKGGFVYAPGDSKAGTVEIDGKTVQRSYGSMSYAGLMSMVYAGLEKDDPRVVAAVDWLRAHFTLEENPRMGQEGLYFYYYTMARALDALGEDTLTLKDGTEVDWRTELAKKLVSLHKHPGYWLNENSRWMESNPYLVSAYTLGALNIVYSGL